MEHKLPYHMVYPMAGIWDEERISKRDREYMKSIYPDMAKLLLPYVEQECDRLEYEGSMIYDEYPDKLLLRMMCTRVCDLVEKYGKILDLDGNEVERKRWKDMVEILVYQELCKRREEWRLIRRRWF